MLDSHCSKMMRRDRKRDRGKYCTQIASQEGNKANIMVVTTFMECSMNLSILEADLEREGKMTHVLITQ